jgi:hypothetical protein
MDPGRYLHQKRYDDQKLMLAHYSLQAGQLTLAQACYLWAWYTVIGFYFAVRLFLEVLALSSCIFSFLLVLFTLMFGAADSIFCFHQGCTTWTWLGVEKRIAILSAVSCLLMGISYVMIVSSVLTVALLTQLKTTLCQWGCICRPITSMSGTTARVLGCHM